LGFAIAAECGLLLARGPDEWLKPVNAGLLFFNTEPERFFPGARIAIMEVLLGQSERLPVRLIGVPVPAAVANKRRRDAATGKDGRKSAAETRCIWIPCR